MLMRHHYHDIDGNKLTWSDTIRYLGVYIASAKMFCCSFKEAKKHSIVHLSLLFGKIGCIYCA